MALEVLFWWHNKTVLWMRVGFVGKFLGRLSGGPIKVETEVGVGRGVRYGGNLTLSFRARFGHKNIIECS